MIRAAIAIGSNSTRMLIACPDGSSYRALGRYREDTKLFMGLSPEGFLSEEAMERTVRAAAKLKDTALEAGCKESAVDLYATSATRDALNRDVFARRLQEDSGLLLYIMSGSEEAELAFAAAADGRPALVADIGGGSTELTLGRERAEDSVSLQLGASRLLKACPIASRRDVPPLAEHLRKAVRSGAARILAECAGHRLVLLGGTGTSAHDILALRSAGNVTAPRVLALAEELADMPLKQRLLVPGLPPSRAEHIVHGLCILYAVLCETGAETAEVSSKTNLDGWMSRLFSKVYRESSQGGEHP